jgi:aminomethyltransferase
MGDAGVTVVRDDGLTGDEGYLVVCTVDQAADVFDTLENRGMNAAPFGRQVWESLTLEAGTPLFETELENRIPNQLGLRNAIDFEKGCFVGQEVVSRIENRGQPSKRLVGLAPESEPDGGAAVFDGDTAVGEVTRAAESPMLDRPVALALVDADAGDDLTVRVHGAEADAPRRELPFVEGSVVSGRLPTY